MLNKKQIEFFSHALHVIKTLEKSFYAFLSGGGGVGKSHLIKSIYQAALKCYKHDGPMMNGASNVIKHIHFTNDSEPSGLSLERKFDRKRETVIEILTKYLDSY